MKFECENCNLKKDISPKHYAKFCEKYVVFGRVTCPKCEGFTSLKKSQAALLGVSAPYNPSLKPSRKTASKAASKTATPGQGSHAAVLRFSVILKIVSPVVFVLILLAGGAGGAIVGIQNEQISPALGGAVGAALAMVPALISSATFRFFRHTLKLLVEIAEK